MTDHQDISFGMACSALGMGENDILNILAFENFKAVELPWEVLCTPDRSLLNEAIRRNKTILCGGVTAPHLTRTIPFADRRMRQGFTEQLFKSLELLASRGIRTAALEIPPDLVAVDPEAEKTVREILCGVAPVLLREEMTLFLPLALPCAVPPETISKFMRETLIPNVKLRLDIHPWQFKPDMTPRGTAGTLAFETRAITFRYDADCGGRILRGHVRQWLDYLLPAGFRGSVLLCPFSLRNRMMLPEADSFADILDSLKNE